MRLVPTLLLSALAGVLLLSGCVQAPPVDERALAAWKTAQDASTETEPDVLGVLTADIAPGEEHPSDVGPGVRVKFPVSHTVDHLEFSCFGNGHMRGVVRIESRRGSGSFTLDELACRDSPHPVTLTKAASTDVDVVSFNGFDSDRPSSWRLVIVGTATSATNG